MNMMARKGFSPFKLLASPPSIRVSYFSSSSSPQFHPYCKWRPQAEEMLHVAVWWDLGTCSLPEGVKPYGVTRAIKAAVRSNGMMNCVLISAVADVFQLRRSTCRSLETWSRILTHIPSGAKHDSYLTNLMRWVSSNPPPTTLFLITDRDFATTLHELRGRNYNILVACNEVADAFCSDASIVWRWNDLAKGEISTGRYLNQPPWRPNCNESEKKQVQHSVSHSLHVRKLMSQVSIGWADLIVNQSVNQVIEVVTESDKYNRLVDLLSEVMDADSRILIFAETKEVCHQIEYKLLMESWPASSLHEGKNQDERGFVLSKFKCGRSPIMIATDVAARDIDLEDIKYVINYDCPASPEDYFRRIWRAGDIRAAFTFVTYANAEFAGEVIRILTEARQPLPPALSDLASSDPSFGDPEDEEEATQETAVLA